MIYILKSGTKYMFVSCKLKTNKHQQTWSGQKSTDSFYQEENSIMLLIVGIYNSFYLFSVIKLRLQSIYFVQLYGTIFQRLSD